MSCPLNPFSTCNAPGERCDKCPLDIAECEECGAEFEDDGEELCPECRAKGER
jgi:RecJ-like exonuclease